MIVLDGKRGVLVCSRGLNFQTFLSMLRKHLEAFVLIPDQQESQNNSQARVARRSWFKRPKLPQVAAPDGLPYVPVK